MFPGPIQPRLRPFLSLHVLKHLTNASTPFLLWQSGYHRRWLRRNKVRFPQRSFPSLFALFLASYPLLLPSPLIFCIFHTEKRGKNEHWSPKLTIFFRLEQNRAASKLCKEFPNFDVVLIDSKDYFENTIAILSTIAHVDINTSVNAVMKVVLRHDRHLTSPNVRIVKEMVKEVTPTKVILSEETIYFDYLILACGTSYRSSIKAENLSSEFRVQALTREASDLSSSESILIVGGGLVGVELAGEIVVSYPKKKLTLATSGDRLLERMKPSVSKAAHKWLTEKGVTVLFGERVRQSKKDPTTFRLPSSAQKMRPDKAYWCTGFVPNNSLLKKNFSSSLADNGYVKVNEFLQVSGVEAANIFAIGDLADLDEEKMAERAFAHAKFVVKVIGNLNSGKPLSKSKAYKVPSKPPLMVISLGPDNALLCRNRKLSTQGSIAASFKRYTYRLMMSKPTKVIDPSNKSISRSLSTRISIDSDSFASKNPKVGIFGYSNFLTMDLATLLARLGSEVQLSFVADVDCNAADDLAKKIPLIKSQHIDTKIPATMLAGFKGCASIIFPFTTSIVNPLDHFKIYTDTIKSMTESGTISRLIIIHPGYRLESAPKSSILGKQLLELEECAKSISEKLSVIILRYAPLFESLKLTSANVVLKKCVKFPLPKNGIPFIAAEDVRDSAIRILASPEAHENRTYSIAGDVRVTGEDLANSIQTIVDESGATKISFEEIPASELFGELARITNAKTAPVYVDWYASPKHLTKLTDDLEQVLEKTSITLPEWTQINAHVFV